MCCGRDEAWEWDQTELPVGSHRQTSSRVGSRDEQADEEETTNYEQQAGSSAAGNCRAVEKPGRSYERVEGQEEEWKIKGKGGRPPREKAEEEGEEKKEEGEEKEKEEKEGWRKQRRIIEFFIKERKQRNKQEREQHIEQQRLGFVGPASTEVKAEPRWGVKDAPEACKAPDGSGYRSGCGRGGWNSWRCPNDQLLQLDASSLPLHGIKRYERTLLAGHDDRPAPAREAGGPRSALASRFIAIQTAMSEGSWRAAQYLEMHPLDSGTPAPMPLLLQARKHAKLVDKSQQLEDPRGGKGNWKNQERNRWNQDEWNKGKGKKGKGRGRGQWSQYHDGWDWRPV